MICEIICVGTELLLGDIVNTDGAFIARSLAQLGIMSYHQTTVGDNAGRLADAIGVALSRSDIIITTGGLGPTCDDITKKAVAEYFGVGMHLDESIKDDIEAFFRERGREMTENNLAQAMIPDGADVFFNKWGTAPGIAISGNVGGVKKTAILLPGPPSECEPMFEECVQPYLAALSDTVIYSLNLHLYGIGESGAEQLLRHVMESSVNPTVAPYAAEHEVRIRITSRSSDIETAQAECIKKADEVRKTAAGAYIYTVTDNAFDTKHSTAVTLIKELRKCGITAATAESCTAGMVASLIGDVPGASDVFLGGVVSYANEVKENILGVSADTLSEFGAVSEQCAGEMARGVLDRLSADIAVSTTGIAGPGGGSEKKPVGTVCFGVADKNGVYTETKHFSRKADRAKIRRLASAHAMMLMLKRLRGEI